MGKVNITTDDGPPLGTEAPLIADLPVGTFFRDARSDNSPLWLRVRNDLDTGRPRAVDLKDGLTGVFEKFRRAAVVYAQVDVVATTAQPFAECGEEAIRLAEEMKR